MIAFIYIGYYELDSIINNRRELHEKSPVNLLKLIVCFLKKRKIRKISEDAQTEQAEDCGKSIIGHGKAPFEVARGGDGQPRPGRRLAVAPHDDEAQD